MCNNGFERNIGHMTKHLIQCNKVTVCCNIILNGKSLCYVKPSSELPKLLGKKLVDSVITLAQQF